ncbi:MAG: aldehyde dehydrogenase [Sinobacteraceae bacterium]|nr:aldehyde dehydrogenase [Nevskiaceae bacterium]
MTEQTAADWHARAAGIKPHTRPFIDGAFTDSRSGQRFETRNPATGEVLAQVQACNAQDVDLAVAAARTAFDHGDWSRCATAQRKDALLAIAAQIRAHADELALLDSLDAGKLLTEARGDVDEAAKLFQWFGEAQDKNYDEVAPIGPGTLATITHEPAGVVGAIVAWNYPLHNASVKLAPALAAGNSVVLKPSEDTPLSALRLAELCRDAGLPDGVFNVVPGLGGVAGKAIGLHPAIDVVGFTGSTVVGKQLLHYSGDSNMKPVWLECGGKSPNIVFDDCDRLDQAVDCTLGGIFTNAGQVCSAHSRLLLQRGIYEPFMERLLARARAIVAGDPLDPDSTLGAIINDRQHARIMDYIDRGKKEATLCLGGVSTQVNGRGLYITPTIFTDVPPDGVLAQEEIFGPVLAVIPFETEDEAVALANNSIYGLTASVWTGRLGRAHRLTRAISAGTVAVNTVDAVSLQTPFGGTKQSGIGRDYSSHGMRKYMSQKTSWIEFNTHADGAAHD